MDVQLMTVSFTVMDNDIPGLVFCSDFSVPITKKTFCKSFISFYENDLRFRISGLTSNKLSFKFLDEKETVLEVFFDGMQMGYVYVGDLYNAVVHCYQFLEELKTLS